MLNLKIINNNEWNQSATKFRPGPLRSFRIKTGAENIDIQCEITEHHQGIILGGDWLPVNSALNVTFENMVHTAGLYLQKTKCLKHSEASGWHSDQKKISIDAPIMNIGGSANYYHWLIDYLPRLILLDEIQEYDDFKIVLNENLANFQIDAMSILEIDESRIITLSDDEYAETPHLINMPLLAKKTIPHPHIPKLLRKLVAPEKSSKRQRLYINRSDALNRRIANESELEKVLSKYNFSSHTLSNYSFMEQASLFHNAEIIISPHGAGLANLVFCQPNTKVIEISHPGHRVTSMYSIAKFGKLHHTFADARSATSDHENPLLCDWLVDTKQIDDLLKS